MYGIITSKKYSYRWPNFLKFLQYIWFLNDRLSQYVSIGSGRIDIAVWMHYLDAN